MVGFLKSRFIRTLPLPKELLCTVCDEVLNDPYNCMNCFAWFCKSCLTNLCSHSQACDHKYVEANKFLKNKIDEMFIRCEYCVHGCEKTEKVCEIAKHEKNCPYKKFTCHHPQCMREVGKDQLKHHDENCPFSSYVCNEGCGHNMRLFEKATHNCIDWLHNLMENQNIKYRVLREENEELRQINENQKQYYLEKIKELERKNRELTDEVEEGKEKLEKTNLAHQKEKKALVVEYEAKINKMREKAFQQISHIRQKSEEHFKSLEKNIQHSVTSYLENTRDNAQNFNNRLQADSHDLILNKSTEINNSNSRISSPGQKKNLNQSLNNSAKKDKGSSGKKGLGNSCFVKI